MKKFTVLFLSLVLVLGFAGCGGPKEPVYTSEEKFEIGMWVGVSDKFVSFDNEGKEIPGSARPMTDEEFLKHYREVADAGINVAFPGYSEMNNGGSTYNLKALKAAHTVGIKQIIADDAVRRTLTSAKSSVESGAKTKEAIVEEVRDLIKPYTESKWADALYGFMIKDEPNAAFFEALGYGEEIFREAAPGLVYFVNLFPVIATPDQLDQSGSIKYDTYLTRYFLNVKSDYVSYDHYPLLTNGGEGVSEITSVVENFLYNMDIMQTKIQQEGNDRKLWTFLQSISFGLKNRALRSKADAGFQAYSFLAYGGDGIQWFCYACPPVSDGATTFGDNALVDREYNKTATYDYVSEVNHEIQALMPYYKNFEWQGVMLGKDAYDDTENFAYLEDSENVLESTETLKEIRSDSEEDVFAGVFKEKNGTREAFMVVNFTDPARKCENKVTLTLSGATRAIVIKNGKKSIAKVKKNKLTFTMGAGEGYFVIPY